MQKLDEKKILGTVPKKLQLVETFWDCPEFSRNKQNQKGITLIALIITIIVMLILVGVTINVALNGGVFEEGEKAAFQTEASIVKEQLEMAKALKVMNAKGKPVDDYSDILVGNLEGLEEETQNKYASIIVVAKNGDICYNPASVTDQRKEWLEEIGINAYVNEPGGSEPGGNEPTGTSYSFTLNELGTYTKDTNDSGFYFNLSNVWSAVGADLSQNSDYYYQEEEGADIVFALTSSNDKFISGVAFGLGISSIGENTQFGMDGYIDGERYWFHVSGLSGEDILVETPSEGQMTHETFMQLYGDDVEFSFVKISDYLQEVE